MVWGWLWAVLQTTERWPTFALCSMHKEGRGNNVRWFQLKELTIRQKVDVLSTDDILLITVDYALAPENSFP